MDEAFDQYIQGFPDGMALTATQISLMRGAYAAGRQAQVADVERICDEVMADESISINSVGPTIKARLYHQVRA